MSTTRDFLISLLQELERAVPPPTGKHHALRLMVHGEEAHDELALIVVRHAGERAVLLDPEDFDKPVPQLVSECVRVMHGEVTG